MNNPAQSNNDNDNYDDGSNDYRNPASFSRRFDDRVNKIIVKIFVLMLTGTIPALVVVAWNDHIALNEVKALTAGIGGDHETLVKMALLQDQHSKDLIGKLDSTMAEEHWRLFAAQDTQVAALIAQAQSRMDRMQAEINEIRQQIYLQLKSRNR